MPGLINFVVPPRGRHDARQRISLPGDGTNERLFGFTNASTLFSGWRCGPYPAIGRHHFHGTGVLGGLVLVSDKEAPVKPVKKGEAKPQSKDRDMGAALRSIYQKTVDEAVPDEFISLLGKLG